MSLELNKRWQTLKKIDFAHTFRLVSVVSLGNHWIIRMVKYCFILEQDANYRTLLKMSIRRAPFGFTLVIVCGKLKHPSAKITLNSYEAIF